MTTILESCDKDFRCRFGAGGGILPGRIRQSRPVNESHLNLIMVSGPESCRSSLANNPAWMKRFGLSMLTQQKDKSIAMRRRIAGSNLDSLAKYGEFPFYRVRSPCRAT